MSVSNPSLKGAGRFAPSPTGPLHVGNLRTALASWLAARASGAAWIVRVEDVDLARCREDVAQAQLRDLARLGLESDGPVLRQSQNGEAYREALARLQAAGRLYPCRCTRRDLALLAAAPHAEDGLKAYPGTCRGRAWEGFDRALRFRLPGGEVPWLDLLQGARVDDPALLTGDPLLFRRDGFFAYHLAVVVDDGAQGVTQVVRGADLLPATATQLRLADALGLPRPRHAHLGLVTTPDGTRLGKRDGALGLEALGARGITADTLLGWLGWSLGCRETPEPCRAGDLVEGFRWDRVPPGPVALPAAWM